MSTEKQAGALHITDVDGDQLEVDLNGVTRLFLGLPGVGRGVYVDRADALSLYQTLGDWLMATEPCDTEPCDTEAAALAPHGLYDGESTVAGEAHAAVYGDRQADYGHPREDFTRTAILWTGLLHHKLADGTHLEPEDIARCQIAVKLARDVHAPKRDNRVDMAGYAITLDRLETGQ